jgi:hypothetical protein
MANGMHRIRRAGRAAVTVTLGIVSAAVMVGCGGGTPPTSPSPPTAPNQPQQEFPTSLRVSGDQSLDAVGETSQLTATATYKGGTSKDVTANTTWRSDRETVATVSPSGLVTAVGFGTAKIMATYMLNASVDFTVVAPGSFYAKGWVHEPGEGEGAGFGVAGVRVREPQSGLSTVTDAFGHYVFGGLTGHHLILDKEDYEQVELDTTGCEFPCEKNVKIQRVFRINAGEVVTPTPLAPMDIEYILGSDKCDHCRRVRVVCPAPGTLRLRLTWSKPESRLSLWVQ